MSREEMAGREAAGRGKQGTGGKKSRWCTAKPCRACPPASAARGPSRGRSWLSVWPLQHAGPTLWAQRCAGPCCRRPSRLRCIPWSPLRESGREEALTGPRSARPALVGRSCDVSRSL